MNCEERIQKVQELIAEKEDDLIFWRKKLEERQQKVDETMLVIESAKEMLMRLEAEREDDEDCFCCEECDNTRGEDDD